MGKKGLGAIYGLETFIERDIWWNLSDIPFVIPLKTEKGQHLLKTWQIPAKEIWRICFVFKKKSITPCKQLRNSHDFFWMLEYSCANMHNALHMWLLCDNNSFGFKVTISCKEGDIRDKSCIVYCRNFMYLLNMFDLISHHFERDIFIPVSILPIQNLVISCEVNGNVKFLIYGWKFPVRKSSFPVISCDQWSCRHRENNALIITHNTLALLGLHLFHLLNRKNLSI